MMPRIWKFTENACWIRIFSGYCFWYNNQRPFKDNVIYAANGPLKHEPSQVPEPVGVEQGEDHTEDDQRE
jgi:hypothetical protein